MEEKIFSAGVDMIYLAACALNDRLPDRDRLSSMNMTHVYKIAKLHSMQAMIYILLSKCQKEWGTSILDPELDEKWAGSYRIVMNHLVKMDVEREALCRFLDENDIWYLCLKGVVMQGLYPTLGMRQMGDNDILVDPSGCDLIRDYMLSRGYEVDSYGKHCHDTYSKGKLHFEIHRMLFEDTDKTRTAYDYYKSVEKKLLPGKGKSERLFRDEDFYVYMNFHAYKHFESAGCGVRMIMDNYVYMKAFGEKLDHKYLADEMAKLGITDYENSALSLANAIFSPEAAESGDAVDRLSDSQRERLKYHVLSNTFGTRHNLIENKITDMTGRSDVDRRGKARYLISRFFPPREYYLDIHPVAGKYLIAIPFLWFIRLIRGVFRCKDVAEEVDFVKKMK